MLETPVIFFIFNRPQTTREVFAAIREAQPSRLLIVADGPREEWPGDKGDCAATRAIVDRIDWACEVSRSYADSNLGLKKRIESGLSWAFERVDEAIILEDDCLPDPSFFRYCAELLDKYRENEEVMSICGSNFLFDAYPTGYSYHFSRYPLIWGWATWKRAWQQYDPVMKEWPALRESEWLKDVLPTTAARRYWTYHFNQTYAQMHTWDYVWTYSSWLKDGLSIVPSVNMVRNIGFQSGATHTKDEASLFANLPVKRASFPLKHPPQIILDETADSIREKNAFSGHGFIQPMFKAIRANLRKSDDGQ